MPPALPQLFSLECWGGATFDVAMRFLTEDPWERLANLRERGAQPSPADAAARRQRRRLHQLSRQCGKRFFVKQAAAGGMDLFRVFDCLNWVENMRVAIDAVRETGKSGGRRDLLHRRHPRSRRGPIFALAYYVDMAKQLEKAGCHILAIKDMAGLLKPAAGASAGSGAEE